MSASFLYLIMDLKVSQTKNLGVCLTPFPPIFDVWLSFHLTDRYWTSPLYHRKLGRCPINLKASLCLILLVSLWPLLAIPQWIQSYLSLFVRIDQNIDYLSQYTRRLSLSHTIDYTKDKAFYFDELVCLCLSVSLRVLELKVPWFTTRHNCISLAISQSDPCPLHTHITGKICLQMSRCQPIVPSLTDSSQSTPWQ